MIILGIGQQNFAGFAVFTIVSFDFDIISILKEKNQMNFFGQSQSTLNSIWTKKPYKYQSNTFLDLFLTGPGLAPVGKMAI